MYKFLGIANKDLCSYMQQHYINAFPLVRIENLTV
jgi:hypothetical protein